MAAIRFPWKKQYSKVELLKSKSRLEADVSVTKSKLDELRSQLTDDLVLAANTGDSEAEQVHSDIMMSLNTTGLYLSDKERALKIVDQKLVEIKQEEQKKKLINDIDSLETEMQSFSRKDKAHKIKIDKIMVQLMDALLERECDRVTVLESITETFNRHNINTTIEGSAYFRKIPILNTLENAKYSAVKVHGSLEAIYKTHELSSFYDWHSRLFDHRSFTNNPQFEPPTMSLIGDNSQFIESLAFLKGLKGQN